MRKALCVGIDSYQFSNDLFGCVNDANSVRAALERNGDGTRNFEVIQMSATSDNSYITKEELKDAIDNLFSGDPEIAFFYYAGHGAFDKTDSYLCTSEIKRADNGVSLSDVIKIADQSKARNKVIILDSCFSGLAASDILFPGFSTLSEGTTIMAACGKDQYASENNGHGVFTELFVEALYGGAMNLLGDVSPGSIYAYIDQALGAWDQRPVFKANINSFVSLRRNTPPISLPDLMQITEIFETSAEALNLDPTYEHDKHEADIKDKIPEHEAVFKILQKYCSLHLVVPLGEEHMYYAAIHHKSCKLTAKGQHYWKLVKTGKI